MTLPHRRPRRTVNIWPGFVDALSTLLIIFMFVLLVFVLAQFFMGQALSGSNEAVNRLGRELRELGETLSLERKTSTDLRLDISRLSAELEGATAIKAERDELAIKLQDIATRAREAGLEDGDVAQLFEGLAGEKELSRQARAQAALLNQQLDAVRAQLARLNEALAASEALSAQQKVQIVSLGERLNQALASKTEELSRYRSEFFGRLRGVLGKDPGIHIEGDRFVFQSEVLFDTGSSVIGPTGQLQIAGLAASLIDLGKRIPKEINWVLRVDGHTDKRRIANERYASNWELSIARALSVVHYLTSQGVPPQRLAAAGFGEYQPEDPHETEDAFTRNRRIELRLDQK